MTMDKSSIDPRLFRNVLFVFLYVMLAFPVLSVSLPPLFDYPNHLARMHILGNADSSKYIHAFYSVDWKILPNLAMDIIVPALAKIMPLEIAGKVFILLTFLLMASSVMAVQYSLFHRVSPWTLSVFLILYNRIFLWGFLNYLFGVGLALWSVALWQLSRNINPWIRLLAFSIIGSLLFFCHLYALAVYALVVFGLELNRCLSLGMDKYLSDSKGWLIFGAQFLTPLALFLSSPTSQYADKNIFYGSILRKISTLANVFMNYNMALDILTSLIIAALICLGFSSKKIRWHRASYLPIIILFIAFLAIPQKLMTADNADIRFSVPLAMMFIASMEINLNYRKSCIVGSILLIIFAARIAVISNTWFYTNKVYEEVKAALYKVSPGSRLISLDFDQTTWHPFPLAMYHLGCISVIYRETFVPSLFAFPTQQPIKYSDLYSNLAAEFNEKAIKLNKGIPDLHNLSAKFDALLVVNPNDFRKPSNDDWELIHRGREFNLYRSKRIERVNTAG